MTGKLFIFLKQCCVYGIVYLRKSEGCMGATKQ